MLVAGNNGHGKFVTKQKFAENSRIQNQKVFLFPKPHLKPLKPRFPLRQNYPSSSSATVVQVVRVAASFLRVRGSDQRPELVAGAPVLGLVMRLSGVFSVSGTGPGF